MTRAITQYADKTGRPHSKAARTLGDINLLRRLLRYEPETGKLFWNSREPRDFVDGIQSAERVCLCWNARKAGKEALTALDKHGYFTGRFNRVGLKAHRAAWAITHGEWPPDQIDHINGNRADNRIVNLRAVTLQENARNKARRRRSASEYNGVSFDMRSQSWCARIGFDGKEMSLGHFNSAEEAAAARKGAERALGFHPNHGRKAA